MENSTKIYIGVGAAALIAFLLLRNKAAAQKPSGTGENTGGTDKDACPAGQIRIQPQCIKAPCNSYCQSVDDFLPATPIPTPTPTPRAELPCPEGQTRVEIQCIAAPCPPSMCMPKWQAPTFSDDILPAPMPPASTPAPYGKMPYDSEYNSEYRRDNMYYQNLFNNGGGIAGKLRNEQVYI